MEGFVAILGIICLLQIGANGQDDNKFNGTVTFSGPKRIEASVGEKVTLNCMGWDGNIFVWIDNRVFINFTSVLTNKTIQLTDGLYPAQEYRNKLFGPGKKYQYTYSQAKDKLSYLFQLNVTVTDADSGIYSCYVLELGKTPASPPDHVELVVLHAPEKIQLEVLEAGTAVGVLDSKSEAPEDYFDKLSVGTYDVICRSMGSYPCPVMTLTLDNNPAYNLMVKSSLSLTGDRPMCTAHFAQSGIDFMPGKRTLTCTSQLPNKQKRKRVASLNLQVTIDKPTIVCANTSAAIDNRYVKLMCNVSSADGMVDCNKLYWSVEKNDGTGKVDTVEVFNGKKAKSKTDALDIMESMCTRMTNGVKSTLTLYLVKAEHFNRGYFLVYDASGNQYKHLVELGFRDTSSAQMVTPMSMLLCVFVASLGKKISKHL